MKKITTFATIIAATVLTLSSCEKVVIAADTENTEQAETSQYRFRLLAPSTTRATAAADFRYIIAADVVNGSVTQFIEQSSTDPDFGTVTLDLSRGSHSLRFFATESDAATYTNGIISMPTVQDCFYKSITFDASTSLGTTDVVLTRLVAKVTNNATDPVTLTALYSNYNILTESPIGDTSDITLQNGESTFVLPPSTGYVTTADNKHIPVSSNHITVIKDNQGTTEPTDSEVLIMTNDTAAFYLSSREIKSITLNTLGNPLETLSQQVLPYRLPTRLEARAISSFIPSDSYWSGERLLCYDDPKDEAVNEAYGTGEFYTFKFNSTTIPVKANPASAYSLKPIRTAPLAPLSCPFRIDFDFQWSPDTTKVD